MRKPVKIGVLAKKAKPKKSRKKQTPNQALLTKNLRARTKGEIGHRMYGG